MQFAREAEQTSVLIMQIQAKLLQGLLLSPSNEILANRFRLVEFLQYSHKSVKTMRIKYVIKKKYSDTSNALSAYILVDLVIDMKISNFSALTTPSVPFGVRPARKKFR